MLDAGAVAIGECGLDFHYDNVPRDRQHDAFEAQLSLAAERSMPVIVHTRQAEAHPGTMIDRAARAAVGGQLHSPPGIPALAPRAAGYASS